MATLIGGGGGVSYIVLDEPEQRPEARGNGNMLHVCSVMQIWWSSSSRPFPSHVTPIPSSSLQLFLCELDS